MHERAILHFVNIHLRQVGALALLLAACHKDEGTSTPAPQSPGVTASASSSATLPPITDECVTAADCTIYLPSQASHPCCPDCTTYRGSNAKSLERFRSACAGTYAACGGSCAQPPTHAECKDKKCVAVADRP